MPHPLLPETVSPAIAGALSGRSRGAIVELVDGGWLPAEGKVHRRIPLAAVEALIKRAITPEQYLSAVRTVGEGRR